MGQSVPARITKELKVYQRATDHRLLATELTCRFEDMIVYWEKESRMSMKCIYNKEIQYVHFH